MALLDVAAIPWITGAFAAACAAEVRGKWRAKRRLNGAGAGGGAEALDLGCFCFFWLRSWLDSAGSRESGTGWTGRRPGPVRPRV